MNSSVSERLEVFPSSTPGSVVALLEYSFSNSPRVVRPISRSPQRGPSDALVTIVIFSDFQCPFCGRVRTTLDRISQSYGQDVRMVFKHNPLPFHQNAMPAAEVSMEAYSQGGSTRFWQMHDMLFENQQSLDRE